MAPHGACGQMLPGIKVRMTLAVVRGLAICMDPDTRPIKGTSQTSKKTRILWNATDGGEICYVNYAMPLNRMEMYPYWRGCLWKSLIALGRQHHMFCARILLQSTPTPEPPSTVRTTLELPEPPVRQTVNPSGHRRTGSETNPGALKEEVEWWEVTGVRKQAGPTTATTSIGHSLRLVTTTKRVPLSER